MTSETQRLNRQRYYALNKDKISEYQRQYRSTHKEQSAAAQRAYGRKHNSRKVAAQVARNRENKIKIALAHGGKCVFCGYENCIAAMEFHHVNLNEKDHSLKTTKEADKCILLCSNCHREHHNGGIQYMEYDEILERNLMYALDHEDEDPAYWGARIAEYSVRLGC